MTTGGDEEELNRLIKLFFFSNKYIEPIELVKQAKKYIERVCSVKTNLIDLITLSMIKESMDSYTCEDYSQRVAYMFLKKQFDYHQFVSQKNKDEF